MQKQVKPSLTATDHAARTRSLRTLARAVIYIGLFCALCPLLVFNLAPGTPIWKSGSQDWPQAMEEKQLAGEQSLMISAANRGNLTLHFEGFASPTAQQGLLICQSYFLANYGLYPQRAFIGRADRIINDPADLLAGDTVPDDAWRNSHKVSAILTLKHSPYAGPAADAWYIH